MIELRTSTLRRLVRLSNSASTTGTIAPPLGAGMSRGTPWLSAPVAASLQR